MLLDIIPADWPFPAAASGGRIGPIAITDDDIHRELGLDFEERLEDLIRREIDAPFGRFSGATSLVSPTSPLMVTPDNDPFDANILEHLFSDTSNDAIFDDWYVNYGDDIYGPGE